MNFGGFFDVTSISTKIASLEESMHSPSFWNEPDIAKKITKEITILKNELEKEKRIVMVKDELLTYIDILKEDFSPDMYTEAVDLFKKELHFIEQTEIEILLNGKYDFNNALLTIHPGAGGTESQDWAEMLLRMYKYWVENSSFTYKVIDYLTGEVAGIKSVTVEITGDFAYGYLKSEAGIHRLVRISPFNAQGKRQTSFVSVFVYPILDDDIEFEMNVSDLKGDPSRASGAG